MISMRKPSAESIRNFLQKQDKLDFTYSGFRTSEEKPPPGYVIDHTRIQLGEGELVYEAARQAIRRWEQFQLGWVEGGPKETPIQKGQVVAVLARAMGLWWLNACRIVSVVDESGSVNRFGFTYGTLPDHVGIGEERFLVEWHHSNNKVWYDILAYSRPNHFLARLGYPIVRWTQKKFGRGSSAAMLAAISSTCRSSKLPPGSAFE